MDIPSSPHDDNNNNQTADIVVYADQHNFPAPSSGPCMVCGRTSDFPSPFKENAFECEFLCGWPVPRDIRERLRRVKEQEERRDAESHGYDADDEQEDGGQDISEGTISVTVNVNNNNSMGAETDGPPSQAADHHDEESPAHRHDTSLASLHSEVDEATPFIDADNVDVYKEMHKSIFPDGVPSPPIRPTTPQGTTNRDVEDGDLQIASSGKRKRPRTATKAARIGRRRSKRLWAGQAGRYRRTPWTTSDSGAVTTCWDSRRSRAWLMCCLAIMAMSVRR